MKKYFRILTGCTLIASLLLLTGCAATSVLISKRNLDVQTKMSHTIFLNPVPQKEKTVYVQIKNTSNQQGMPIKEMVSRALLDKGYTVTHNLAHAHYLLQANVLHIGEISPSAAEEALSGGYGGALAGAGVGFLAGGTADATIGGALAGVAVSTVADALVKDVTYVMITDVRISERIPYKAYTTMKSTVSQGSRSKTTIAASGTTHWNRYQTRIVSTAEKVNLSFKTAEQKLAYELAHSIAGIF